MSNLRSSTVTPSKAEDHTPSVFRTLCTKTICTGVTSSIHLGSLDTKILNFFQKLFSHPSVSLSSFINLVVKVKIFIRIVMHVLSHGCILNSYKALFHLHTWLCMLCDFTSSGCKCLFIVYGFILWEASCHKSCLVSHDVVFYYMLDLLDPCGI